jgi:uncharacterized small protein (DUF1192 family)
MSDYHGRIMNIYVEDHKEKDSLYDYMDKSGKMEMRESAAKIAKEADEEIAALKAEIERLQNEVSKLHAVQSNVIAWSDDPEKTNALFGQALQGEEENDD